MSDPDTDPYTAYYEFEPVFGDTSGRRHPHATVLHELGLAGSPCQERAWGTKVEVRCPACGTSGKVVSWDGAENVYSCPDCDTVFDVPSAASDERPAPSGGPPAGRATIHR